VVVVDRAGDETAEVDVEAELRRAMTTMSLRDAADAVAAATGQPRRRVYQIALALGGPG
jgi:16S rRNA (cytidine1402-2'-O)-methyltransferase